MLVEEVGRIDMNCAFCLVYENMAISRAKPLFLSVLLVNHFTKRLQCFWGISLVQKYLYDLGTRGFVKSLFPQKIVPFLACSHLVRLVFVPYFERIEQFTILPHRNVVIILAWAVDDAFNRVSAIVQDEKYGFRSCRNRSEKAYQGSDA